jgi:histidinol dehydrogenase
LIPIFRAEEGEALAQRLQARSQLENAAVTATVQAIVADVRARGDAALLDYTRRFDGADLRAEALAVTPKEIKAAYAAADEAWVAAMRRAAARITAFHEKQRQRTWIDFDPDLALGQMVRPLRRVGVYVPGGTAAYPSSVLMNVLPARVAGVGQVVMVTPPAASGAVNNPLTLVAADIAGVDVIYKVGGAQAVAALAFGTATIPRVDKIVGPGNIYVANAKREVFGHVGIDMVAGPSEVLVIADGSARAAWVAADMLSQAEHDPLAAAVLATDSEALAHEVAAELARQASVLPRRDIVAASLADHGAIVICKDLAAAADVANSFAPEHLELAVADPFALLGRIRNAGAVFLGHHAPEPLGDYYAGPNHVLPTSGTARFFSPLGVDDFIKKSSLIYYTRGALAAVGPDIVRLARAEGLEAHARAVSARLDHLEGEG